LFSSTICQIYHGSRTELPAYLTSLGFEVPSHPEAQPSSSAQSSNQSSAQPESESDDDDDDDEEEVTAASVDEERRSLATEAKMARMAKKKKKDGQDMADFLSEWVSMPFKAIPKQDNLDGPSIIFTLSISVSQPSFCVT
jgi:hypothetical protein